MHAALRVVLALVPLLVTVLFGWTVSGPLSLGAGEKDIILVIPLALWSFCYLGCFVVLWWRGARLARTIGWSTAIATVLVVVASIALGIAINARTLS
jgi:hypothetical protein